MLKNETTRPHARHVKARAHLTRGGLLYFTMDGFYLGQPIRLGAPLAQEKLSAEYLVPAEGRTTFNVVLPLGIAPGAPLLVQVPGFGFGALSGTTHILVAGPGSAAGQVMQVNVSILRTQPAHLGLFNNIQTILLFGEGDLSFSLSLARAFGHPGLGFSSKIFATTYDSRSLLRRHYNDGDWNRADLKHLGATVIHNVDATLDLGSLQSCGVLRFADVDAIVFNFPHPGWIDGGGTYFGHDGTKVMIARHQQFLRDFFLSVSRVLASGSSTRLYVTAKDSPFGYTAMWNIAGVASSCGFTLVDAQYFTAATYPGYNNKYGAPKPPDYNRIIDQSFLISNAGRRRRDAGVQEAVSRRNASVVDIVDNVFTRLNPKCSADAVCAWFCAVAAIAVAAAVKGGGSGGGGGKSSGSATGWWWWRRRLSQQNLLLGARAGALAHPSLEGEGSRSLMYRMRLRVPACRGALCEL